jgi:hypothetical protein
MLRCGARSELAARRSTPAASPTRPRCTEPMRRADEPAAAEILAPVTDLLLTIYRRRPAAGLDVTGDAALVDFWLERVAFG